NASWPVTRNTTGDSSAKETLRSTGVSPQRSRRRAVVPGSGYSVASRTKVRTVARITVAPAFGPRVRSTPTRPLESVKARVDPNRPLVTPKATTSPLTGPPAVSRTWKTRGSVGRVPTKPCCPTPKTNAVSVVDKGGRGATRGGAATTGGGGEAACGATIRRAVSAGDRRGRGGRGGGGRWSGKGGVGGERGGEGGGGRNSAGEGGGV